MARAAIFLTLIAATLIGPCLCCCALAGTIGSLTGGSHSLRQAPVAEPTCPYCLPPAGIPTADHPARKAPTDPFHPCPHCSGRAAVAAVAPPLPPALQPHLPFVALLPVASDISSAWGAATAVIEYRPGWGTQAFLLDACHRLRC